MEILIICLVALFVAGLTFFSGFGLGTLLLPAIALFFPITRIRVLESTTLSIRIIISHIS